jgi:hypothetical protein
VKDYYETAGGTIRHLELELPNGSTDIAVWTQDLALPADDGRPFNTDATFVWQRKDREGKPLKEFSLKPHEGSPSRN